MFCHRCGGTIERDSRFCRHCGAAQESVGVAASSPLAPPVVPPVPASGSGVGIPVAVGGAVVVALIAALAGTSSTTCVGNASDTAPVASITGAAPASADPIVATPTPSPTPAPSNWSYSTDEDKVRGTTKYFARTTSTNSIHQDPPYDDETTMRMTVRYSGKDGDEVMLSVSSGQLMCPSYGGCEGTVRFDKGPARTIRFTGTADDSSDTIFVENAGSFLASLRRARHVVIEKTMYQAGSPQFEFAVAGLHWKH